MSPSNATVLSAATAVLALALGIQEGEVQAIKGNAPAAANLTSAQLKGSNQQKTSSEGANDLKGAAQIKGSVQQKGAALIKAEGTGDLKGNQGLNKAEGANDLTGNAAAGH